jgi:hypothetical protein
LSFTGFQVAVVGNRGPSLGQAEIVIDDDSTTVSAASFGRYFRQILFASPHAAVARPSDLTLTNGGSGLDGGFELDAFLVLGPGI